MTTPTDKESLVLMLKDIRQRENKLTGWEEGFIKNVGDRIDKGRSINVDQDRVFTKIWERVTDRYAG